MNDPEFLDSPTRPAIKLVRRYPHPIDRVWRAITSSDNLRHWFPCEVNVELVVGGLVTFGFGGDGKVRAVDPPQRLTFTWEDDLLDFELMPDDGHTVLTFTHHFGDRAGAASFATGWEQCLVALAAVLADREPEPSGRADQRHEELVTRFGLDLPQVTTTDSGWLVRFERQLVCPADTAWKLFFSEREVVPGADTELVPEKVYAATTAPDEPGDRVRLELTEGTGHGVRLVLEVTGTDPAEVDAAIDQWGGGALGYIVREAARLAGVS